MTHISRVLVSSALAAIMSFSTGVLAAPPEGKAKDTTLVDCTVGESIQNVLDGLPLDEPHEVIVLGLCEENIVIRGNWITLKAHSGLGSIDGTDSELPTIAVTGREITVQDFTPITGNYLGVMVRSGGMVSVLDNTIEGIVAGGSPRAGNGIVVVEASFALVSGNTIQSNARNGVVVWFSSGALIEANIIDGNGRRGIVVDVNSSAEINGNTVTGNGFTDNKDGIGVFGNSYMVLSGDLDATPNVVSGNAAYGVNCGASGRLYAAQLYSGGNGLANENNCQRAF